LLLPEDEELHTTTRTKISKRLEMKLSFIFCPVSLTIHSPRFSKREEIDIFVTEEEVFNRDASNVHGLRL
jgi:cytidylate kinase